MEIDQCERFEEAIVLTVEKLFVFHTNDIHSHFEYMPQIHTALKQLQQRCEPHHTLLLDIGDHIDRVRLETEGTGGKANIAVMNYAGYEACVPGNNEGLTLDKAMLRQVYSETAQFPVIGTNMTELANGAQPDWMLPYLKINKGPIRIGIIGLTAAFNAFYHELGWSVLPPLDTARTWVNKLRAETDVIIVMSHLGLSWDEKLAESIPGIDCILGGHTHHLLLEPIFLNGTMICAAGKFGQYVGEAEIHFDSSTRKIVHKDARCHATSDFAPDSQVQLIIDRYGEAAHQQLSEVVTVIERPLAHDGAGESVLGNLLAAGLRKWTEAEIGLVNAGQIIHGLDKGVITREIMLEICPSPINPCRMRLQGKRIRQALEAALEDEMMHKPIMGFGFRGKILGTLCFDGLEVVYDADRTGKKRIVQVYSNGAPLEDDRMYVVGTIDMFTFGIGYLSLKEGVDVRYYLPEFIRDVLSEQLKNREAIAEAEKRRWIPHN